ncbi:EAL domain-containing protein [Muricomes sp. OA1]|uniref:GGDEF domain-containing protein n=1 Tax=Hungatella hathewayi TaxID=154046 RepID=A0A3E2WQG1_9FIRM|nr:MULTISPECIES: EAL domain-containing protein [Clostridia]MCH1972784.1 EAL domain-containing protein [Muricomes sp. OA1]RGC29485.1 GGDEF domain-containing protein [Hungatella hathewayi]GKH31551.1 GGDEF domain-containing protein [Faecalicatena contorta]
MKKKLKAVTNDRRPLRLRGVQIVFISAVVIITLLISIWNAADLRSVLSRSTKQYLYDVTTQTTREISNTMNHRMEDLKAVANSASRMQVDTDIVELAEFLRSKVDIFEFSFLFIVDNEGKLVSSSLTHSLNKKELDRLSSIPVVKEAFEGKVGASYLGGQEIIYTAPVTINKEIKEVVVGIRNKEKMQEMIAAKSFSGNSLSCIIDSGGNVILSPTDVETFMQLDDIFKNDRDSKVVDDIYEMKADLKRGKNGILEFTSIKQEELYLSYNPLNINDWFLLTLIPADIISEGLDRYVFRSFLILGFVAVACFVLLLNVYRLFHESRKRLERFAFMDEVTGGMNQAALRLKFLEIGPDIALSDYYLVQLNVKGFKLINERYGSEEADGILRYIYQVLDRNIDRHKNEFAARSGSDHFTLCLKESRREDIQMRLDKMFADIHAFEDTDIPRCELIFQQGACMLNDQLQDITILQDRARLAYQYAEPGTENVCAFYSGDIAKQVKQEQELNDLFQDSITNHDFQVYLQPKAGLESGRIEGAEALVRWNHPKKGVIFPSDFIPLFEKSGKICQLDLYMFEEVCKLLKRWTEEGKNTVPVSVNLSRLHFQGSQCLEPFIEMADKYGIAHEMIEFELTESIFFDDGQISRVKNVIRQMHEHGFSCSLDDFGSGFSSLGLLKEFDVDVIKLDRLFFLDMSSDKAKAVIACLLELAKRLHVKTVAEGIEEPAQLEYLRSLHCDMVQGYVISRPLPVEEFEKWSQRYGN